MGHLQFSSTSQFFCNVYCQSLESCETLILLIGIKGEVFLDGPNGDPSYLFLGSRSFQHNITSTLQGCFLWQLLHFTFVLGFQHLLDLKATALTVTVLFYSKRYPMAEVWVTGLSWRAIRVTDRVNYLELPALSQRGRCPTPTPSLLQPDYHQFY